MNKNTKVNRHTVMAEANALRGTTDLSRSECVKLGYKIASIYAAFAAGALSIITFVKADGTLRTAQALAPSVGEYLVKGTGKAHPPKANILYYDVEKQAFRSLVKARLVSVA